MFGLRRSKANLPETLRLAGREVPVTLVRSARARRILLRADAVAGRIRVTLPPRAAVGTAAAFVADHAAWLEARVSAWPVALPFTAGAAIPFDGGTLHLELATAARRTVRDGDRLIVAGCSATLPGRTTRWLKAAALADLTAATLALTARLDRPVSVRIGDPAGRWGSCAASGHIAYSWRLILAPPEVRASVVAHEVAHLVHPNHGAAFWALAHALGGDPTPHRRWLARHGAGLHWVGRAGLAVV